MTPLGMYMNTMRLGTAAKVGNGAVEAAKDFRGSMTLSMGKAMEAAAPLSTVLRDIGLCMSCSFQYIRRRGACIHSIRSPDVGS